MKKLAETKKQFRDKLNIVYTTSSRSHHRAGQRAPPRRAVGMQMDRHLGGRT